MKEYLWKNPCVYPSIFCSAYPTGYSLLSQGKGQARQSGFPLQGTITHSFTHYRELEMPIILQHVSLENAEVRVELCAHTAEAGVEPPTPEVRDKHVNGTQDKVSR